MLLGESLLRPRHRHPQRRQAGGGFRAALGALFPLAPERAEGSAGRGQRALSVALQVAAVCLGAVVLLARVAHIPAWDCIYAEDYGVYLVQALQRPWPVFVPYNGYLQLVPRLIAQAASLVPLTEAAVVFAASGALIAAACGLFAYHASAGFIRSAALRAVLGASLVLLPIAPLEVADNGVNSIWYIMAALFWAVLWRPRSRAGMAVAAVVAFAAAASLPMAIVYAPLLIIRVIALPRLREHAVTAGWLAGLVLQVPMILQSYANHTQRLGGTFAAPGPAVAYYLHTVVLRVLGWHLSWHLVSAVGTNGATAIVGAFLAIVLGWAAITQGTRVRVFVLAAVLAGLVFTLFAAFITSYVVTEGPLLGPVAFEAGSRYSVVPIFLLDAALVVAADAVLRRRAAAPAVPELGAPERVAPALAGPEPAAPRRPVFRPRAIVAVAALACVLGFGWVTDFRYVTQRTTNGPWLPQATAWLTSCEHSRTGTITVWAWFHSDVTLSCSRLQR